MSIQQTASGEWLQLKGAVKEQWGKLTNDDITEINGSREKLVGKLVSTYSMAKDKAENDVDKFWKEQTKSH